MGFTEGGGAAAGNIVCDNTQYYKACVVESDEVALFVIFIEERSDDDKNTKTMKDFKARSAAKILKISICYRCNEYVLRGHEVTDKEHSLQI